MRHSLILAIVLSCVGLLSCTKKSTLEYGLKLEETLRINLLSEPPSLDWHKSTDTTSALVTENLMDGLMEFDYAVSELPARGALATEMVPSNQAKTWTITLRQGVLWSDGVPFTAQHAVDGIERVLNPKTASEYGYFLFTIKNARAYNEGKIKDFSQVGVKINDKGQIVIELEQPQSYFPYLLTHHSTFPIRKDVVEKYGDKWTDPDKIVTLGAYKLKVWEHDKNLVLERNDSYWGEKAKIKNVLAYMINEYSTALNLYESGKLDFQQSLPSRELANLRKLPGYRQTPIFSLYYYGFNTRKPPFNNVKVRRAFAQAIDRKQITDLINGGQVPLSSWIPVGMFGYEADRGLKFDPEAAAKLLDEAGFKDRSKLGSIKIGFNTNEDHQRIAENVQAQLKKNLGVDVELRNEEWKVYLNSLKSDPPNIYRMGWVGDYPDPDNFMNLMTSYSENNRTGWKNLEYDKYIKEGASIVNRDQRKAVYSKAQALLTEQESPVIPIYSSVTQNLISDRVQNFPLNAMNRFPFKGVSFK